MFKRDKTAYLIIHSIILFNKWQNLLIFETSKITLNRSQEIHPFGVKKEANLIEPMGIYPRI